MGSDLYLNPPPPPPIHEQVRALHDRYNDARTTITQLRKQVSDQTVELEANDRLISAQQKTIYSQEAVIREYHDRLGSVEIT